MQVCQPGWLPRGLGGVAFSPQATPQIRCNERVGAQVGTQRALVGVPSCSQKAPFASSCADTKVPSSSSESLVHHQSRHLHKLMLELSEPHHGALKWWEKPFEIFRMQEQRDGRLFPHNKWHSAARL